MQHFQWTKTGRILSRADEGKPNHFRWATSLGRRCVEVLPGQFAPYLYDAANSRIRFADHICDFHDWYQAIKEDKAGEVLVADQRFEVQRLQGNNKWRVVDLFNRELLVDQQDDHCIITRHHWDNEGNDLRINFLFRPSSKVKVTFTLRVTNAGTYRIRFQNTGIAGEAREHQAKDEEGNNLGRVGVLFDAIQFKWNLGETSIHDYTVETQAGGKKLDIFIGSFDLAAGDQVTVSPTTWGPTEIAADANDGYERTDTGWANGTLAYTGSRVPPVQYHAGFSFQYTGGDIPSSATINSCYFRCYQGDWDDPECSVRIQNYKAAVWSSANKPSGATWVYNRAATAKEFTPDTWFFGSGDAHEVNLNTDLAALITNLGTLTNGDWINICVFSEEPGEYISSGFEDYSDAGTNEATLYIDYTAGGVQKSVAGSGTFVGSLTRKLRAKRTVSGVL